MPLKPKPADFNTWRSAAASLGCVSAGSGSGIGDWGLAVLIPF